MKKIPFYPYKLVQVSRRHPLRVLVALAVSGTLIVGLVLVLSNPSPYTPEHCFIFSPELQTIRTYRPNQHECSDAVNIPPRIDGVEVATIGASALRNKHLISVTLPDSVRTIQSGAFADNHISYLNLSSKLQTIQAEAFAANQLEQLQLPNTLLTMGRGAFRDNSLSQLTIPNSVQQIGNQALSSNPLEHITFAGGNAADFDLDALGLPPTCAVD
jgi:hypothetical protein